MSEYESLVQQFDAEIRSLASKYNTISYLRLTVGIVFLILLYLVFVSGSISLIIILFGLLVLFIFLLKRHQKISSKRELAETLKQINLDEMNFLEGRNPYENGSEFLDTQHLYAFDLDVFGADSLFQHLNRTTTFRGAQLLARTLQERNDKPGILENQAAVAELDSRLSLRQKIRALGLIHRDDEEHYRFLIRWMQNKSHIHRISGIAIYFLPAIFFLFLIIFSFTQVMSWLNAATVIFIINLALLGNHQKKIRAELSGLDKLDSVIKHYGFILDELQQVEFQSPKLRKLKERFNLRDDNAGSQLGKLATLLNQLDSVFNGMAVMLFSGTACYHLHVLKKLYLWKVNYGDLVEEWLEVIAEFEVISSLSNFRYNNPGYVFPVISERPEMAFKRLGHPLVPARARVCNDLNLNDQRFIILTGSNMSGKSTFLRSVGINTVLANAGSVICAGEGRLYPFQVLVSMRVADSLAENESYFYAEVKRLKQITDLLGSEARLVLLDEILRGTNSDDKRTGTLEVIRRMVREGAYGMIATHDLEICNETASYPDILTNKCFEVEIRDNELYFDYKLRDGICVNQSATFLMKKTGII